MNIVRKKMKHMKKEIIKMKKEIIMWMDLIQFFNLFKGLNLYLLIYYLIIFHLLIYYFHYNKKNNIKYKNKKIIIYLIRKYILTIPTYCVNARASD